MSRQMMIEPALLSDKLIKQILENYLVARGWDIAVSTVTDRGIDIKAKRDTASWIIRANFFKPPREGIVISFVSVLGEILQRMDDPSKKYSVAFPDIKPFRRLWDRLPTLAKDSMGITALFVNQTGTVNEIR